MQMAGTCAYKRCSCGQTYDRAGWLRLPLVGESAYRGQSFEFRNCTRCESTLTVPLPAESEPARRTG